MTEQINQQTGEVTEATLVEVPAPAISREGDAAYRMALAMRDIEAVGKWGKNQSQNYKYRALDDILNMVHNVLGKHGLFMMPRVLNHVRNEVATRGGGTAYHVTAAVEYRFYSADGSFIATEAVGEAMDSGDKALGKALQYALKYLLVQVFLIPTLDPADDSDSQSYELGQRQGNQAATRPAASSKPQETRPAPASQAPAAQQKPKEFDWKCTAEQRAEFEGLVARAKAIAWDAGKLKAELLTYGLPSGNYTTYNQEQMGVAIVELNDCLTVAEEAAAAAAAE